LPALELDHVTAAYGQATAVRDLSLHVGHGEIVALLGSNGAGKSTTLRTISGLMQPRSGNIFYNGHSLRFVAPWKVVRLGIAHVPEGRRLFAGMTVLENLRIGTIAVDATPHESERRLERVFSLFPRLRERTGQLAGTLSGGEQQMCAIGRALMTGANLLMLDEPSLGLAPNIVDAIFEIIQEVNAAGATVLLVEQNAALALRIASRAYVMENGSIVRQGSAAELATDAAVKRAYLGV
jgi:branched-chain amino acid transport system ATP-binding protein